MNCPGCRFHSRETRIESPGDQSVEDLSPEMFEKLCKELRAMKTGTLFLLGEGEPFLHERFTDIVSLAKGYGFYLSVITNGTLLDAESLLPLIRSGLDSLQVSLWASSAEEFEEQYPGVDPTVFSKIVRGLTLLRDMKVEEGSPLPSAVLHQPINRINFQCVDEVVDLAQETGCEAVSFSPFLSHHGKLKSYSLSREEEESLFISLKRLKARMKGLPLVHNIDRVLLRYRAGPLTGWRPPCYIAWYHSRVRVDGTVVPCGPCNKTMGSLAEESFQEIWNGRAYRRFRRQLMDDGNLAPQDSDCDCEFCCYVEDSLRIHRVFRWVAPLTPGRRRSARGGNGHQ
jgi:MoaA/NifB/PqqE/SkfB family radical SAM enzyme